jgi:hypothetical protein
MTNYEAGFNALFDEKLMTEGLEEVIRWWNYNIGNDDWVEQIGLEIIMDYLFIHNMRMEIEVDKEPDFDLGEQWKPERYFLKPLEDADDFYAYEIFMELYEQHKAPVLMIVKYNYNEDDKYNNELWITYDGKSFSGVMEEL